MIDESITDVKNGLDYLYNNDPNMEEEILHVNSKKCYVFFSSNGLFRGKTIDEFKQIMLKENRYEWKSIVSAMSHRRDIGKVIYLRDVYQWYYMHGINNQCTTIDAVINLLRMLTEGYEVTTVGVSGGGYMAVVCGCELNAQRVFCISGQYDLTKQLPEVVLDVFEKKNGKYVNSVDLIRESYNVPIYYFCPQNCESDYNQLQMVKHLENVRCFLFPDETHAATVYPFNFPDILCLSNQRLNKLEKRYRGKNINKKIFLLRTVSVSGIINILKRGLKSRFSIKNMKKMWDLA